MWLVNVCCPLHGMPSLEATSEHAVGLLMCLTKIEEVNVGNVVSERMLTRDLECEKCSQCLAQPFTVLEAERCGWRAFPQIPKKCVLKLLRKDSGDELLEALEVATSQDEITFISENYLPKRRYAAGCFYVKWLQDPSKGVHFSEDLRPEEVLESLRQRIISCGLDDAVLMTADLSNFPLLVWHIMQITSLSEEQCLLAAMRFMQMLESGKTSHLLSFHEMPRNIAEVLNGLYAEVNESKRKLQRKREELLVCKLAEKARCGKLLLRRSEIDTFDRQTYLDWGDSKKRSCCAFNFVDVRGCATCLRAFTVGRELDELKKNPPDWAALDVQITSLDEEIRWLTDSPSKLG